MMNLQPNRAGATLQQWLLLLTAATSLLAARAGLSADPLSPPDDSLAPLIEELDDPDFARRESAVNALQEQGADAIDVLVAAARRGSPEVASRSVQLLERLMESDETAVIDAADIALTTLLDSDHPHAAALAADALARHVTTRQDRALAELTAQGAQVQYGPEVDMLGQPIGIFREEDQPEPQLKPRRILIPRDWKGGTQAIDQLRRLPHLRNLEVYVENGSGVPIAQVQSLSSVLPGLIVHQRGAYLGVGTSANASQCEIGEVKPEGPADKAGLQRGDVVLALDDHQTPRFNDLVEVLQDYEPGTTATITVERDGRVIELPVEVAAWEFAPVVESTQQRLMLPGRNIRRLPNLPAPPQPQRP